MRAGRACGRAAAVLCAALVLLASAPAAHGQEVRQSAEPLVLGPWRDGVLVTSSAVALVLAPLIPVNGVLQPRREWFPGDEAVKGKFSLRADRMSDVAIALAVGAPFILHLPVDAPSARRALVYGESLAANLGAVQVIKYLVQRPRPFNHHPDGRVRSFAARRGHDSYISFFSGHASTSFTAAVAGSFLYALQAESEEARALVWGTQLALATATANWRVRAGRHYYSDVLVGALLGTGIGLGVPLLHLRDRNGYWPSALEWGAMAGGLGIGLAVSHLAPLETDPGERASSALARLRLVPMVVPGAAGLALSGQL